MPANSFLAAETLIRVGLRKPPVSEKHIDGNKILVDQCRAWWEKVKSGKIAFSLVGQNVEYRFKPDGTWESSLIDNPTDDVVKPPKVVNPTKGKVQQQNQPQNIMAIKLIANYSKRLGLPGYSSHQFSVSVETELVTTDDVAAQSEHLYQLLQSNVDEQILHTGFVPPATYGMDPPAEANGHTQPGVPP